MKPLSATRAVAAIEAGTLTAQELVRACLDRIVEREPVVKAWAFLDPALAMAQAKAADSAGGGLLRGVRLFDLYRGPSIPAGTKSLAFALTYQAEDRTLTDKEVDKAHKKIEDRLQHVLKAQIRGKDEAKG